MPGRRRSPRTGCCSTRLSHWLSTRCRRGRPSCSRSHTDTAQRRTVTDLCWRGAPSRSRMKWCSMSRKLISHSADLKRLRQEGYDLETRGGFMLVKDVPYVNSKKEVKR